MSSRRVYPSWLPPNPRERTLLAQLRRQQAYAIGWLVALLPAGWIVLALTSSTMMLAPLTLFWILVGAGLAQRVSNCSCPRCAERFCVRRELPHWYGLFAYRCENCGLTLYPEERAD